MYVCMYVCIYIYIKLYDDYMKTRSQHAICLLKLMDPDACFWGS